MFNSWASAGLRTESSPDSVWVSISHTLRTTGSIRQLYPRELPVFVCEMQGQADKPFSEREDFKDVTPVPQDDGQKPVCPIAYAPECTPPIDKSNA